MSCNPGRTDYTRIIKKDTGEDELSKAIPVLDRTSDVLNKKLSRINLIKYRMLELIMEEAEKSIKNKTYVDKLKERFLTKRNQNYFEEMLGKLRGNKVIFTLGARIHLKEEYRKMTPGLEDKLYQIIGLYNG